MYLVLPFADARKNMGKQRIELEDAVPVEINNKIVRVKQNNVEDSIMVRRSRRSIKYFDSPAKPILKEIQKRVTSSGLFKVTVSQSSQEYEAEYIPVSNTSYLQLLFSNSVVHCVR